MAKITQIFALLFCCFHFACKEASFQLGSERMDQYLHLLEGKKVAVVGNQTSTIGQSHLVDTLLALKVEVVKVFAPEHGFRGTADAGALVEDGIDKATGLPIVSLYGKNKKPSKEQLQDVDVILFDIQDVGARFYTYISSLHYVMEAAAEHNTPLIVLDRPNPNGHYVDGPILDTAYQSFVGMHPIPVVHGMTMAEYALMINGQEWTNSKCDLAVIPMLYYKRTMPYSLPIKPSPNLPNEVSVNLYPSLCFFEGTNVSVGRGTDIPFQHYGAPYLESDYVFVPQSGPGSKDPKHENDSCFGVDLRQQSPLSELNLDWLIQAYRECPSKEKFFNNFFDKLAGTDQLRIHITNGKTAQEIRSAWQDDLIRFAEMRRDYLIY